MDDENEVGEVIIRTILALPQAPLQVDLDTNVVRDLGLDSLAVMNFVMTLEDRFDVSVPMDRLAQVETIRDLAATINDIKGRQGET